MTTLRVIIDELTTPLPGSTGRYAEELTRALIAVAPRGTGVEGVVSASTEAEYEDVLARLPRLAGLFKSALARRELMLAWQHGFTRLPGGGMVHSPSLLAPLSRHDRLNDVGDQSVVTIHDTLAWTHPEALGRHAGWVLGTAKRAQRYADAIVVPTHAVAARLADRLDLGDRIRVIEAAPSTTLALPADPDDRLARLALTARYVATTGGPSATRGTAALLAALTRLDSDVVLAVLDADAPDGYADAAVAAGLPAERVVVLPPLGHADRAVVLDRAAALVIAGPEDGFGLPMLDAFALGTPVVHTDSDAHLELAADAGLLVEPGDDDTLAERLADAVRRVLDDAELAERLGTLGQDRARAFSWRSTAEKTWQLHADL